MFDFEKLEVYQLVKEQTAKMFDVLPTLSSVDSVLSDQIRNASLLALTNLVQATGRLSSAEKQVLLANSRGYIFEVVAILDLLAVKGDLDAETYQMLYNNFERISKMLLGMYRSYNPKVE